MKIFIFFILPFSLLSCQKELSKNLISKIKDEETTFPSEQPQFPGGNSEMYKYILNNFKVKKTENYTCSKVIVNFIVLENGKLENIEIVKGFDFCPNMKKELIEVFKKMPTWKAGKVDGKIANVKFTIPIIFEFDYE